MEEEHNEVAACHKGDMSSYNLPGQKQGSIKTIETFILMNVSMVFMQNPRRLLTHISISKND